ncbi:MAG TPA: hypothetical protein VFG19_16480 [Geobacteraceae bacterium]|nr:hypothetical protein [Geobacteraceae bacterium]
MESTRLIRGIRGPTPNRYRASLLMNLIFTPVLLGLLACSGGSGSPNTGSPAAALPVITSFTASPTVIAPGQSSQLAWTVSGATSLSLNGAATSGSGTNVSPAKTATYTLTATNAAGTSTASVTVTLGGTMVTYADLSGADLGIGANLNGAIPFPASNAWNSDISTAPADPNSDSLINSIGLGTGLHPDFGSGLYQGAPIGIPYVVVSGSQPKVPIILGAYKDESDPGPYPVPPNAPIEGQMADGSPFGGDRHVLVIDRDANRLYELGNAYPQGDGSWQASVGALFHLDSNIVRPGGQPGWTSADAAGLPIFPGLVRYEEAASGVICHALRFTVNTTRRAYVPPATHWASSNTNPNVPPMGMRVRLKASFVIPGTFSTETKAILQALKTYGMLVADNGSNWYISGAPDPRWDNDRLVSELASVKGSNFEVVRMDGLVVP